MAAVSRLPNERKEKANPSMWHTVLNAIPQSDLGVGLPKTDPDSRDQGSPTHPMWEVADTLVSHKFQHTAVRHAVRVLVGQFEKHGVGNVESA